MLSEFDKARALQSALEGCVVVRAWWAGIPLSEAPLAEFVVDRGAPLPVLVYGLLDAIGFHEDHLWCLAQPRSAVGSRRVGTQHAWSVPEHWRFIRGPVDEDMWDAAAEYADALLVDELAAGEDDEAWLLFDFGERRTFRFKFASLASFRRSGQEARKALEDAGLPLPSVAAGRPVTVLNATGVEQYPS